MDLNLAAALVVLLVVPGEYGIDLCVLINLLFYETFVNNYRFYTTISLCSYLMYEDDNERS